MSKIARIIGFCFVFSALHFSANAQSSNMNAPTFRTLPQQQTQQMNAQRLFVEDLLKKKRPGHKLSKSASDFDEIQALLVSKAVDVNNAWGLQALGVVFGDALIGEIADLSWCEVTDEFGTDPTVRLGATTYQINALTMVSKRVEKGEPVSVVDLARSVKETVVQARGRR